MMGILWPLLISWLTGAAIVWSCWAAVREGPRAVLLMLCLSLLAGLAISSCTAYVSMLLFPRSFGASLAVELAILLGAIGVFISRRMRYGRVLILKRTSIDRASPKRRWLILGATLLLAVAAVACVVQSYLAERAVTQIYPHGDYDAWQFWNLRARCIFREGSLDRRFFAPPLNPISHPLLLPMTIVRGWNWDGTDSPRIAAALSILFGMLTPFTLFGGILWLRGGFTAALATIVLLSPWGFPVHCGTQLADAPIGVFMIAAVILAAGGLRKANGRHGLFFLSGLMTGAAAWTKNEGLLFCVLMGASVFLAVTWRRAFAVGIREFLAFSCGAGLIILFVAHFRLTLTTACPAGLGHELSGSWTSIFDASRHRTIFQVFQMTSPRTFDESIFPWCLAYAAIIWIAGLFAGVKPGNVLKGGGGFAGTVALLTISGYYAVLLVTPHDLYTLLCAALCRLLLQLWPLAVLGFFLCLPALEELLHKEKESGEGGAIYRRNSHIRRRGSLKRAT